jgi:hypothetical protein
VTTYTTSAGVTVRIHSERMATPGSEEERQIIEAQRRAAFEIMKGRKQGDTLKAAGSGK